MSPLENHTDDVNIKAFSDSGVVQERCAFVHPSSARTAIEDQVARMSVRLEQSERLGLSLGEETLTDILLLEIAATRTRDILVHKTPKWQEARDGLDWEWLIGNDQQGWLRYAVQAKKAKPDGYYSALGHMVNGERQIDILKRYAAENRAIPLYCFYNYRPIDRSSYWNCGLSVDVSQLGVTVAELGIVEEAFSRSWPSRRRFEWLHSRGRARPVRCLTCCPSILRLYVLSQGNDQHQWSKYSAYYRTVPDDVLRRISPHEGRAEIPANSAMHSDSAVGRSQPKRTMIIDIGPIEWRGEQMPLDPNALPIHREY